MNIKVEFSFQIVRAELSKADRSMAGQFRGWKERVAGKEVYALSFIPSDDIGKSNLVHPREKRDEREKEGRNQKFPFVESL